MELKKQLTLQLISKKEHIESRKNSYTYNKNCKKEQIENKKRQIKTLREELKKQQEEYKEYKFKMPTQESYTTHIKDLLKFAEEHNLKPIVNKDCKDII